MDYVCNSGYTGTSYDCSGEFEVLGNMVIML